MSFGWRRRGGVAAAVCVLLCAGLLGAGCVYAQRSSSDSGQAGSAEAAAAPTTPEVATAASAPAATVTSEAATSTVGPSVAVPVWTVQIVESVPHDPSAFTQGLELSDGVMYESTGLWGRSSVRSVEPSTGEVLARTDLPDDLFGEGLTVVGEQLIQLTWRSGTAVVYDRDTLVPLFEHSYAGEGWGLCLSDDVLVMSDGSEQLSLRDPATFELVDTVAVSAVGYDGRVDYLNELECTDLGVIANVWQSDRLLVIDHNTGEVTAAIDASALVEDVVQHIDDGASIDVLNGVAAAGDGTFWMTGKLWPRTYRVRFVESP